MSADDLTIRALRPDEWQLFRDLRIRQITDAPDAFGAVLEEVIRESDDYWREFTARFADDRHALLVGFVGADAMGSTYARVSDDGGGHIGAMWIAPRFRRRGFGERMLRAGIDWHLGRGVVSVQLWVTEGNEPATALYRANGFTMTGARERLREGSNLQRLLMHRTL